MCVIAMSPGLRHGFCTKHSLTVLVCVVIRKLLTKRKGDRPLVLTFVNNPRAWALLAALRDETPRPATGTRSSSPAMDHGGDESLLASGMYVGFGELDEATGAPVVEVAENLEVRSPMESRAARRIVSAAFFLCTMSFFIGAVVISRLNGKIERVPNKITEDLCFKPVERDLFANDYRRLRLGLQVHSESDAVLYMDPFNCLVLTDVLFACV